jgi:hypothetical protein
LTLKTFDLILKSILVDKEITNAQFSILTLHEPGDIGTKHKPSCFAVLKRAKKGTELPTIETDLKTKKTKISELKKALAEFKQSYTEEQELELDAEPCLKLIRNFPKVDDRIDSDKADQGPRFAIRQISLPTIKKLLNGPFRPSGETAQILRECLGKAVIDNYVDDIDKWIKSRIKKGSCDVLNCSKQTVVKFYVSQYRCKELGALRAAPEYGHEALFTLCLNCYKNHKRVFLSDYEKLLKQAKNKYGEAYLAEYLGVQKSSITRMIKKPEHHKKFSKIIAVKIHQLLIGASKYEFVLSLNEAYHQYLRSFYQLIDESSHGPSISVKAKNDKEKNKLISIMFQGYEDFKKLGYELSQSSNWFHEFVTLSTTVIENDDPEKLLRIRERLSNDFHKHYLFKEVSFVDAECLLNKKGTPLLSVEANFVFDLKIRFVDEDKFMNAYEIYGTDKLEFCVKRTVDFEFPNNLITPDPEKFWERWI